MNRATQLNGIGQLNQIGQLNEIGKTLMHFSPAAIALSTTLALVSSVSFAQSDYSPSPRSAELVEQGQAAQKNGAAEDAFGLYVSALAYDPRNAHAYVQLAELSQEQQLYGSAIRYYKRALELRPNDPEALAGQGRAYMSKGAVSRAEANLQQLKLVCASPCAVTGDLAASIAAGPPQRQVSAAALESEPTADTEDQLRESAKSGEGAVPDEDAGVLIDEKQ